MSEIELPGPDGYDLDGVPWWRLTSGERVYVLNGLVYGPGEDTHPSEILYDALIYLAAANRALCARPPHIPPRPADAGIGE